MFQNPWYGQVGGQAAEDATAGNPPQQSTSDAAPEAGSQQEESRSVEAPAAGEADDPGATGVQRSGDPLVAIQQHLKSGWTAHLIPDGRLFYCK
jgi:hypothetical protein